MTKEMAIRQALRTLGDGTSLNELSNYAAVIMGNPHDPPSTIYCCNIRRAWRLEKGTERDNRTYAGQPRRNMLRDDKIGVNAFVALSQYVAGNARQLSELLNNFHSLDQLKAVLGHIDLIGEDIELAAA